MCYHRHHSPFSLSKKIHIVSFSVYKYTIRCDFCQLLNAKNCVKYKIFVSAGNGCETAPHAVPPSGSESLSEARSPAALPPLAPPGSTGAPQNVPFARIPARREDAAAAARRSHQALF